MDRNIPEWYDKIRKEHREYLEAVENLGETVRRTGPLDEKTSHLVQLAGAASIRSEGAVHSHTRRAMKAGASAEEIRHTILLLTSTIGFPAVSAALSWAHDLLGAKK